MRVRTAPQANRPNTSIFLRPVKRRQPYKPSEVDFHVGVDTEHYGDPKIAIGSSRKPKKPPPPTPAPGDYDIPHHPIDTRLKVAISNTGHEEIRDIMTTNIDYIDSTIFPAVKPLKIGNVDNNTKFITKNINFNNDKIGCNYNPQVDFAKPSIQIGNKQRTKDDNKVPGPGKYSPEFVLPRSPVYKFSGPVIRDEWMTDRRNIPSPNKYSPFSSKFTSYNITEKQAPIYSIGFKSRNKKGKKKSNNNRSTSSLDPSSYTPFPVGQFIAKIDNESDNLENDELCGKVTVRDARKFVQKHPELKEIVDDIFDRVFEEKPDDPLSFLLEYFNEIKERERMKGKQTNDDEFDLNQIIIHLREKSPEILY